ncbi:glycosyltransferase family 87 protein [Caballeronia insecticola]|uniref:Polyprenol-phosphate-mannose-dependent alpha-(1-2)-phosphatidylinositol mannoside mannosyltransferase n=1 Tax=Caballeronia insecticola TaxID=758793 RepID=R4WI39_9BURK|nr:glycosyltransferase family 87 protein [Caballeronia insecticola]BAN23993.1 putative uncharacterized protein [Caballeronia insecticola]
MSTTSTTRSKYSFRLSAFAAALAVIALCLIAVRAPHIYTEFRANPPDAFSDFNYYLFAFTTVLRHPGEASLLYDQPSVIAFLHSIGTHHIGVDSFYAYPPQFALAFAPLGALAPLAAKLVWVSVSVVLFALGVAMTAKFAYRGADRGVTLLIVALALLSRPFLDDIYWGQSNELLFFLLAATFFFIDRGNRYLAGVFLGVAIAIKVTPIPVAGLLLLRREWRTVITTVVTAVAITIFTGLKLGFNVIWHYFVADMSALNTKGLAIGSAPFNNSLRGAIQTLAESAGMQLSQQALFATWLVTAVTVSVLAMVLVYRRSVDRRMDFALAAATMLVGSPMLEPVHMVAALIPLAVLFGTSFERPGVRLSAFGPRVEMLLAACAILILVFAPRSATYTLAMWIIYALCLGRYFPPAGAPRDARAGEARFAA